jgi:hypothetical protein
MILVKRRMTIVAMPAPRKLKGVVYYRMEELWYEIFSREREPSISIRPKA